MLMDWSEALEIVVGRTGRDLYRRACSEDHGDHLAWRAEMIRQASDEPPPAIPEDPWRERIRACPHFQPGCCASPAPYCDRFAINPTREQCISCLSERT